ncbi:GIGYF family protein CG11148-like isoform X1 [Bactrocera tryoni]|uniref:GYF-like protein n=1 Tax=Bactrocera tryoni TaxID=59916 RepID=A0A4Y5QRD1_BACRY|nr:GIGYF family protein CG11148-like isoform X1 [Bactrocera tryoni]QCX41583.1 GYF-like protein [Bactrocera tryoni]
MSVSSSLLSSGCTTGGDNVMFTSSNSNNSVPRNTFPVLRYTRKELLSLCDKNYKVPEILPTFKQIFVEKVHLPLAVITSRDELLLQVPPFTRQRPSRMQRSLVGFNTCTRGGGRGGFVNHGRMHGKSNYKIYKRYIAKFGEADPRSIPVKIERGGPERNGGGNFLCTGGGNMCVISSSLYWRGTPILSPRKEFYNHPRNLENWRRNRNDRENAPSSGVGSAESWRGNMDTGCNFAVTHHWEPSNEKSSEPVTTKLVPHPQKLIPVSMWDLATLEQDDLLTVSPMTTQLKDESVAKHLKGSTKRAIKQQIVTTTNPKVSEVSACNKKNEADRRRDQAEDKHRKKEEKKRQQSGEEKRHQQQLDDEKRRQMVEQNERQLQILVRRRQAILGNIANNSGLTESVNSSSNLHNKNAHFQSSVAPWSTQSNAASSKGVPCLAEIQKVQRRERQMEQRKMKMFRKRVHASANAAVEAFDSMLKWNVPVRDVPVKSFAEIQAEEAKCLANEKNMLKQRHKEQEQQHTTTVMSATSNTGGSPNNTSAVCSSTKAWGSTNTTVFWDKSIKFSAVVAANNNSGGK